jgi:hypothetical protein
MKFIQFKAGQTNWLFQGRVKLANAKLIFNID